MKMCIKKGGLLFAKPSLKSSWAVHVRFDTGSCPRKRIARSRLENKHIKLFPCGGFGPSAAASNPLTHRQQIGRKKSQLCCAHWSGVNECVKPPPGSGVRKGGGWKLTRKSIPVSHSFMISCMVSNFEQKLHSISCAFCGVVLQIRWQRWAANVYVLVSVCMGCCCPQKLCWPGRLVTMFAPAEVCNRDTYHALLNMLQVCLSYTQWSELVFVWDSTASSGGRCWSISAVSCVSCECTSRSVPFALFKGHLSANLCRQLTLWCSLFLSWSDVAHLNLLARKRLKPDRGRQCLCVRDLVTTVVFSFPRLSSESSCRAPPHKFSPCFQPWWTHFRQHRTIPPSCSAHITSSQTT